MFGTSVLLGVSILRAASEASRASYASQRKLDKRIILIALAQRFPSSRST